MKKKLFYLVLLLLFISIPFKVSAGIGGKESIRIEDNTNDDNLFKINYDDHNVVVSYIDGNGTTTHTIMGIDSSGNMAFLNAITEAGSAVPNATDNLSFFASTTSLQLLGAISDETGSGALCFATSPTFTTQIMAPIVYGSLAENGDITVEGTSSGTKTTSYVILQPTSGNVGIGTTSPNAELEISSTSPELSISNTTDTDNGTRATDVVFYGTNGSLFEQGRISCYHDSNNDDKDGAIKFLTNDGSDADGALTERMVINNTGNVGIGTTGPGSKLEITGGSILLANTYGLNIKNTAGTACNVSSISAGNDIYIGDGGGNLNSIYLTAGSNDDISFRDATTVNMVIKGSGNVGIGTTSPQGNVQISSTNAHGGYVTKIYEASSGTLTGATDTIELAIPSGWRILQCQLHVKTAVTDDAGDDTWSSELNDGGIEETISAGSAAAQNTNVNHWADADTWGTLTDAETDILLTPNGGNFSAGEIEAHCLCQGFDNWDNE